MTGSSHHKSYPYAEGCIDIVNEKIPESQIVLVGELACRGMIEKRIRIYDTCGQFGIRKSLVLIKTADLLVSPETATAVGAGAFETPLVVLLSHSSEENLTKYYKNCIPVYESSLRCYPCHQLHFFSESCPLEEIYPGLKVPKCVGLLHPKKVLDAIEKQYLIWRKNNGSPDSTYNH